MKKYCIVCCFFLMMSQPITSPSASPSYYQPAEKSDAELVMDMFFSLMLPTIQQAVSSYYSDYLTESPLVYPYQIKILTMERTNHYRGYIFSVKIEVTPVVGPHNPVGRDQLTFTITPSEVTLKKFEHMETYELPPNWRDIIKEKKPFL